MSRLYVSREGIVHSMRDLEKRKIEAKQDAADN
jgi:hypothetical protein